MSNSIDILIYIIVELCSVVGAMAICFGIWYAAIIWRPSQKEARRKARWEKFWEANEKDLPTAREGIAKFLSQELKTPIISEALCVQAFAEYYKVDLSFEAEFSRFKNFHRSGERQCPWTVREALTAFLSVLMEGQQPHEETVTKTAALYNIEFDEA